MTARGAVRTGTPFMLLITPCLKLLKPRVPLARTVQGVSNVASSYYPKEQDHFEEEPAPRSTCLFWPSSGSSSWPWVTASPLRELWIHRLIHVSCFNSDDIKVLRQFSRLGREAKVSRGRHLERLICCRLQMEAIYPLILLLVLH